MDSSSSSCPFCSLTVPSSQLERHANSHFEVEDEQLSMDLELAQQLAFAPSSPLSMNNQTIRDLPFTRSDGECIAESISSLVALQTRTTFHEIEGGVMALLRECLETEPRNTTSFLCGYTDHIQSIRSEDSGWGCGWRNIQMLSSHLLMQRKEAQDVLFGGAGFVPDIPSLQRWLEIAWGKGFDTAGSDQFGNKVYGLKRWIGTTECAALFRSFGLRARIVDFGPKELEPYYLSCPGSTLGEEVKGIHNGGKRKPIQVCGPMDRYFPKRSHDINQASSSYHENSSCSTSHIGQSWGRRSNYKPENKFSMKSKGHQVLMDWIWNYFNDGNVTRPGNPWVIMSDKTPLYFQHDGHSRTIVGIQVKNQQNGIQQHTLLILDPGHRTAELERSLKQKRGWQKLIKRGVQTLRKPQYQLCYIDPGISRGVEVELLKTMDSVFVEL